MTPPGRELLDDLFSLDLERYVAWYSSRAPENFEVVATFLIWMKDKVCFLPLHLISYLSYPVSS